MGNSSAGLPPGVDVRGEGGYVIAPGAISEKGLYDCPQFCTLFSLIGPIPWPQCLLPQNTLKRDEVKSVDIKPTIPLKMLESALMEIPNNEDHPEHDSRDNWFQMIASIYFETNGSEEGRLLAHKWSEQSDYYNVQDTDDAWYSCRNYKGVPRTGKSILAEASKDYNWRDLSGYDEIASDDMTQDEADTLEKEFGVKIEIKKRGLRLFSPSECENLPIPPYVIKGLIAKGQIGAIIGSPGAGKSFIAPYIGYKVALGEPIFGMLTEPGTVFYIAAEDFSGMAQRVVALKDKLGLQDNFYVIKDVNDLFSQGSDDLKLLMDSIEKEKPNLIIIDTLAMAFPGLEENAGESMGKIITVLKQLAGSEAAVFILHHDTKKNDGLPRGHSSLNGALDVSIHLKRNKKLVVGSPTKNRNGTTELKMPFEIRNVIMEVGDNFELINTAICNEVDASSLPQEKATITPSAQAALNILENMLHNKNSVTLNDWRSLATEDILVTEAKAPNDRNRAFTRAVKRLLDEGLVVNVHDQYRLAESDEWNEN